VKALQWAPAGAFLAVSLPVLMLLNLLEWGGDYKVWLAIALGVIASGVVMGRLGRQAPKPAGDEAA